MDDFSSRLHSSPPEQEREIPPELYWRLAKELIEEVQREEREFEDYLKTVKELPANLIEKGLEIVDPFSDELWTEAANITRSGTSAVEALGTGDAGLILEALHRLDHTWFTNRIDELLKEVLEKLYPLLQRAGLRADVILPHYHRWEVKRGRG